MIGRQSEAEREGDKGYSEGMCVFVGGKGVNMRGGGVVC